MILCTKVRLVTVCEQTWKQVAGKLYIASGSHTHTDPQIYAYTTWGQVHKARRLLTWQHRTSPLAAYLQKKTRFCSWCPHTMGKIVSWKSSEWKSSDNVGAWQDRDFCLSDKSAAETLYIILSLWCVYRCYQWDFVLYYDLVAAVRIFKTWGKLLSFSTTPN